MHTYHVEDPGLCCVFSVHTIPKDDNHTIYPVIQNTVKERLEDISNIRWLGSININNKKTKSKFREQKCFLLSFWHSNRPPGGCSRCVFLVRLCCCGYLVGCRGGIVELLAVTRWLSCIVGLLAVKRWLSCTELLVSNIDWLTVKH